MRIQKIKNTFICVALIFANVFAIHCASAETDSDRNALEAIYQQYTQAIKHKDPEVIFSYETDDFSVKTVDGKTLNHQQADAAMLQSIQSMKAISSVDVKVMEVKTETNQTTVVVSQKIIAKVVDSEGKEYAWIDDNKSRDSWIKVEGKWKIKFSKNLEDSQTFDGKPAQ
jgi:ketosteroid isomerase-like protein